MSIEKLSWRRMARIYRASAHAAGRPKARERITVATAYPSDIPKAVVGGA